MQAEQSIPSTDDSRRLLNPAEVTERLRVSRAKLYRLIKAKQFPPPRKLGRSSFWSQAEIDAYIDGLKRETTPTN